MMSLFRKKTIPEISISQLRFNDGKKIEIKKNDIVVFVGPNNAGKSQSLKDIWALAGDSPMGIVIKELQIKSDSKNQLIAFLQKFSKIENAAFGPYYSGFKFSFYESDISKITHEHLGKCRNAFMSFLCTDERLPACNPPDSIEWTDIPMHPIQQIARNPQYRKTVTDYFMKAFGVQVAPNPLHGKTIPLYVGKILEKSDLQGKDAQETIEWITRQLEQKLVLHEQGDGMRSLAGVLLYLSIDFYRTFLIDEPESFLHPPQAAIMGQIIAEILKDDQQAFISTHSQHFIQGLLEKAPERVKIIRITRTDNQNTISVLNNDRIGDLLQDPLLKHSGGLDGMFYKNVVICESDSDCQFYSIINDHLKLQSGKFSETLFIHSSGKERLETIARTLKALNIDFRVIPDIDIMNQENVFKKLIESCGGSWNTFQTDYNVLVNGLENVKNLTGNQLLQVVQERLPDNRDAELSHTKINELKELFSFKSRWDDIKEKGIKGAPRGNATVSMNNIVDHLKEVGIFVVPVGELECFINEIGDHGSSWLNKVLEKYPDLNHEVFNEAKRFVSSWGI